MWDDPIEGYKNGREYLIPCLETHKPIDLITILLGTNDLKKRFSVSAYDVAASAGVLIDVVQKSAAGIGGRAPQILLMAPPPLSGSASLPRCSRMAVEKSRKILRAL